MKEWPTYDELVARGYRDCGGVLVGPRCPSALADTISPERPIHLVARQSLEPSMHSYLNVARDTEQAAKKLAEKLDIYVWHLAPSREHLADLLASSTRRGTWTASCST